MNKGSGIYKKMCKLMKMQKESYKGEILELIREQSMDLIRETESTGVSALLHTLSLMQEYLISGLSHSQLLLLIEIFNFWGSLSSNNKEAIYSNMGNMIFQEFGFIVQGGGGKDLKAKGWGSAEELGDGGDGTPAPWVFPNREEVGERYFVVISHQKYVEGRLSKLKGLKLDLILSTCQHLMANKEDAILGPTQDNQYSDIQLRKVQSEIGEYSLIRGLRGGMRSVRGGRRGGRGRGKGRGGGNPPQVNLHITSFGMQRKLNYSAYLLKRNYI